MPEGTTPLILFVGVIVNVTPVQIVPVIAVIAATGFMVTVRVNANPFPQAVVDGVTV